MVDPHFFFLFIFIILYNLHTINSSTCSLDFKQFPYEAGGECFDAATGSNMARAMDFCCSSALQPVFQAMTIRANLSGSIFLDPAQAKDCSDMFQGLHNRTNLSNCRFQDFISSTTTNACSRDINSVMDLLGVERYNGLRSSCRDLSIGNHSNDACYNCVVSYRTSLQGLEEVSGVESDDSSRRVCAEALLVSVASSDVGSMKWVQGIFSCLWDEIQFPWPQQMDKKGSLLASKKFLSSILVAAALVVLAPILYKITRKRLQDSSEKEMENLSVIVLKKTLEDDFTNQFSCSGSLYIFSQDEIAKATNYYNKSNLIGEGSTGKMYLGILPSGMKVAIKRINEGMKLYGFNGEICKMGKIRHPNLVSILGYCDRGDQCLVYEYCVNGNLATCLLGDLKVPVLTWEQRLQIAIGVARGLWFLHNNPLEKMVHGNLKLANILLNERLEAKVSNFVLSNRLSRETIVTVAGRMNYGLDTIANDVFKFGVVLLQLLTGRKEVEWKASVPRSLVNKARKIVTKGGNINALADPRLKGEYNIIAYQSMLSLTVLCTTPSEHERPNLEEILQKLLEAQNQNYLKHDVRSIP